VVGLGDNWDLDFHGGELHLAHVELDHTVTLKPAQRLGPVEESMSVAAVGQGKRIMASPGAERRDSTP